ncbi:hypothetical protein AVEN_198259-1 [Araneus ventricosus]|uniref:Uncharacterized protein n=1 Tax=Araneus ventricosus TaxID=182803 RepID=A0A4Y2FCS8_ARAVE|nr:hypothetical protein AVEN_198259-1 [Araneus ventricosus]
MSLFLQPLELLQQLDRHGAMINDRTPPHVPATITVAAPVGSMLRDRTPPHICFCKLLQLPQQLDGHGTMLRDRKPPHSLFLQLLQMPHDENGHGTMLRTERRHVSVSAHIQLQQLDGREQCSETERRPMSLFLLPLELPHQLDRHGTMLRDRTPPHVFVYATITVAATIGWTWNNAQRQSAAPCPATITVVASCFCFCNHYSWMDMEQCSETERRPMSLFLQPLQLPHQLGQCSGRTPCVSFRNFSVPQQLNGHGTIFRDRAPPHVSVYQLH